MVYLLHFSRPYKHARHFIGTAPTLERALAIVYDPARASRSPLLRAAYANGVRFTIADQFPGDVDAARRLQRRKETSALCSVCRDRRRAERLS